jgi:hypothetical protein
MRGKSHTMRHAIFNTLIFALLTAATAAVLFSIGISLGHAQSSWKDGKPTLCTATKSGDAYCS